MPEIILLLSHSSFLVHHHEDAHEVENLQETCNAEDTEAKVAYKAETVKDCPTVYVSVANAVLRSSEVFVGRVRCVFPEVEEIDPEVVLAVVDAVTTEVKLDPDPLVIGHGEQKRQEGDGIEDRH